MNETHPLLIEIRCEELPPSMVRPALTALENGLRKILEGVSYGEVTTYATPRRLAVQIVSVPVARPKIQKQVTGPSIEVAYRDGQLTPAGIGFARGKNVDPSHLYVVETAKGRVIAVTMEEGGEQTLETLAKALPGLLESLPFAKSMEWGRGGVRFGRPIQGIIACFGKEVIPGRLGNVVFGRTTEGHRLAPQTVFEVHEVLDWAKELRTRWVEPDLARRAKKISDLLVEAGAERDAELEEQVLHLVEWPSLILGEFDEELLKLPYRLLVESMKVHQRYFPIFEADGRLSNRFAIIGNNPEADTALVAAGNARVLRARFYDARFFFAEDQKYRLEHFSEKLTSMRWIKGLGTMADKQRRITRLGCQLAGTGLARVEEVQRAGELCKADLLSQMVGEFPELQGHMGRVYGTLQGESLAVSLAIEEHYQPKSATDTLPTTGAGTVLALAERLDTLVGCFAAGLIPKGGDPLGLRRAANGLVSLFVAQDALLDLRTWVHAAIQNFHVSVEGCAGFEAWKKHRGDGPEVRDEEALLHELIEFILARWRAMALASGGSADLVEAILAGGATQIKVLQGRYDALVKASSTEDFVVMMHTFKRALNISLGTEPKVLDSYIDVAEETLAHVYRKTAMEVEKAIASSQYDRVFLHMLAFKEPLATFFDQVLVDSNVPEERERRRGLLAAIASLFSHVADFSRISTRG